MLPDPDGRRPEEVCQLETWGTCSESETLDRRDQAGEISRCPSGGAALDVRHCLPAPHLWNCTLRKAWFRPPGIVL